MVFSADALTKIKDSADATYVVSLAFTYNPVAAKTADTTTSYPTIYKVLIFKTATGGTHPMKYTTDFTANEKLDISFV